MRINQFVAAASGLSRRAADAALTAGRVTIAGRPATIGETVLPETAGVQLDGRPLSLPSQFSYIMLHKPAGYVSSHNQQGTSPTLYELLPPELRRLRLVGRLDAESSGLVLLTNDGRFIQSHAHPSHDKAKIYELTLTRPFAPADAARLRRGIMLTDGPSLVEVLSHTGRQVTAALQEGRNRQLRRTFGAIGYGITRLHRLSIGPYQLGNLPSGRWQLFLPEQQP